MQNEEATPPSSAGASPMKTYKCSRCPFSCDQVVRLSRHEKKHDVKADHQCQFCSFSCRSSEILAQHLRLHPNFKTNSMEPSTSTNNLSKFEEDSSSNSASNSSQVSTPTTPKTQQKWPQHSMLSSSGINASVLSANSVLGLAMDTPPSVKKKRNLLSCDKCPYKSMHGCDMKAHLKMHEPPARKHSCTQCTYSAMRLNALRTHELLHSGVQPEHIRLATEERLAATAAMQFQEGAGLATRPEEEKIDDGEEEVEGNELNSQQQQRESSSQSSSNDTGMPLERYISEPSAIGQHWPTEDGIEVTLRVIFDRSNRYIGEKRCLLTDYDNQRKAMREEADHHYRCAICNRRINYYAALFDHIKEHFKSRRGRARYSCDKCDFTADKLVAMRGHKSVHANDQHNSSLTRVSVPTVSTNVPALNQVSSPLLSSSVTSQQQKAPLNSINSASNGESEKAKRLLSCAECPFKTTAYTKMWHHNQKHVNKSRFSCTECSFSSGAVHCLTLHLRMHALADEGLLDAENVEERSDKKFISKVATASASAQNTVKKNATRPLTQHVTSNNFCEFTLPSELASESTGSTVYSGDIASRLDLDGDDLMEEIRIIDERELNEEEHEKIKSNVAENDVNDDGNEEEDEGAPQLDYYAADEPAESLDVGDDGINDAQDNVEHANLQPANLSPVKGLIIGHTVKESMPRAPPTPIKEESNLQETQNRTEIDESVKSPVVSKPKPRGRTPKNSAVNSQPVHEFKMCTRKKRNPTPLAATRRAERRAVITARANEIATADAAAADNAGGPSSSAAPEFKSIVIGGSLDYKSIAKKVIQPQLIASAVVEQAHENGHINVTESDVLDALRGRKSRLRCKECPFECWDRLLYSLHTEMHVERGRPFRCNVCTYNCTGARALHAHLSLHAPPLSPTSAQTARRRRYAGLAHDVANSSAIENGTPSASGDLMPADALLVDSSSNVFQCTQCNFKTHNSAKFYAHRTEHVQLLQQRLHTTIKRAQAQAAAAGGDAFSRGLVYGGAGSSGVGRVRRAPLRRVDRMLACAKCAFRCDSAAAFSSHAEMHNRPAAIFHCTICDYGANTHNIVLYHERNHHLDGSMTVLFRNMDKRKRIDEYNQKTETKRLKLSNSDTSNIKPVAGAFHRMLTESNSLPEKNSFNKHAYVMEDVEMKPIKEDSQKMVENSGTNLQKMDEKAFFEELKGRVQLCAGMFRCVRCDFVFGELVQLGRHWQDHHVNNAEATDRDRLIGEMLRMNLVSRSSMTITV